jgi:hypothetical protein
MRLHLLLSCYVGMQGEAVRSKLVHAIRSATFVKPDPIPPDDQGGRVVRFRPRGAPPRGGWRWPPVAEPDSPVDDLAKYERGETSDDYRHRMTMNLLTLLIAAMLIGGGVWLSTKLIENRNLQDCFLSGRRNCAPIAVPTRPQD